MDEDNSFIQKSPFFAVTHVTDVDVTELEINVTKITAKLQLTVHHSFEPDQSFNPAIDWGNESVNRRLNMDRITDWPWCWEEEIAWRADLEERDDDFLQELIDNAIEDIETGSFYYPVSLPEEMSEDAASKEYLVTA